MNNSETATEIDRVIRGELDDCERALIAGNTTRALRELDDAVTRPCGRIA